MKAARDDGRPPAERVDDVPRILDAMGRSVSEALLRHKRAGNPIAVWRDGAVVWIPPEEIDVDEAPGDGAPGRA